MMKLFEFLSKDKPYNVWECQTCGNITPIRKGLPEPECEYCRRVKESKVKVKIK